MDSAGSARISRISAEQGEDAVVPAHDNRIDPRAGRGGVVRASSLWDLGGLFGSLVIEVFIVGAIQARAAEELRVRERMLGI